MTGLAVQSLMYEIILQREENIFIDSFYSITLWMYHYTVWPCSKTIKLLLFFKKRGVT